MPSLLIPPVLVARESYELPSGTETSDLNLSMFNSGLAGVDQSLNFLLAAALGITLAGLCLLTLVFRWTTRWHRHVRHLVTMSNPDKQRFWARNQTTIWPYLKRHLLAAPLFKKRRNRQLQLTNSIGLGSIPSRVQTLLLFIYVASNIAYCLVLGYDKRHSAAVVAELRGRTGVLATLNLIPTILFALRNNPLILLLNVPFDTFNLFHRWCARVVVVETLLHTLCYIINTGSGGATSVAESLATTSSYQWGMVAMGALLVMIVLSFSPIRHAFYEAFTSVHRLLAIAVIVGVYLHIEKANLPQLPYVRAVIAMWALEILARGYGLVHHNLSIRFGITHVLVEALPAEACRVTFQMAKPWKAFPGAHVHIYLPTIALWSSHPFSVAWSGDYPVMTSYDDAVDMSRPVTSDGSIMNRNGSYKTPMTSEKETPTVTMHASTRNISTVSVIMRARTGMTRSLYSKAIACPGGQLVLRGAIEGPYGGRDSLSSYGTVVLFAGGVGITHQVSFVKSLLERYAQGTCSCQRLLLVWSVTNTEALEWVRPWMDEILHMEGRKDVLRIQLFITKPRHQNEVISNTGTVQMFPGRCIPKAIIEKEFADRIGSMAITVCGPGSFADNVRAASRPMMELGSVDFIEESFTY